MFIIHTIQAEVVRTVLVNICEELKNNIYHIVLYNCWLLSLMTIVSNFTFLIDNLVSNNFGHEKNNRVPMYSSPGGP